MALVRSWLIQTFVCFIPQEGFPARSLPLTTVPTVTPPGAESFLRVAVIEGSSNTNQVEWREKGKRVIYNDRAIPLNVM